MIEMKSFKREDPLDMIPDIAIPSRDESSHGPGSSNPRASLTLPPQVADGGRRSPGLFPHGVVTVHVESPSAAAVDVALSDHESDPFKWIKVDSVPDSPCLDETHSMSPTLRTALVSVTRSNDSLSGLP